MNNLFKNIIVVFLAVFLAFTLFYYTKPKKWHVAEDRAKVYGYNSVQELTASADLIVEVSQVKTGKTVLYLDRDGDFYDGYTPTEVVIDKVWKGNKKVGDKIIVAERFFKDNKYNTMHFVNGYKPLKNGKKYILLLDKSETTEQDEIYYSLSVNYGVVDVADVVRKKSRIEKYKTAKDASKKKYDNVASDVTSIQLAVVEQFIGLNKK